MSEENKKQGKHVHFGVIIGNPPYQEVVAVKNTKNGQKRVKNIFQFFQEQSDQVSSNYISLIYPGKRWIHRSGKGMKEFGYDQINDPHLEKLIYFEDANQIFSNVDISDGITIVVKNLSKTSHNFKYEYHGADNQVFTTTVKSPGERLLILDPQDMAIADKIDVFVKNHDLKYIHDSKVINQKLFRIESSFVEEHKDAVRPLTSKSVVDYSHEVKLFANDKAGKSGRSKWFIVDKKFITHNSELINEYQVVVSSANAGGQKRDNQIQVIDNHSAFGRSRIALKSFATLKEAQNFLKYAQSYLIKYAFLLTDEQLTSLGKEVPDLLDYSDSNNFIDYSQDVDSQLFELFNLNSNNIQHIKQTVDNLRHKKEMK